MGVETVTKFYRQSPFSAPPGNPNKDINERFALLVSIEDHAEPDRRTLADLPLQKTVQMSGTASPLIR